MSKSQNGDILQRRLSTERKPLSYPSLDVSSNRVPLNSSIAQFVAKRPMDHTIVRKPSVDTADDLEVLSKPDFLTKECITLKSSITSGASPYSASAPHAFSAETLSGNYEHTQQHFIPTSIDMSHAIDVPGNSEGDNPYRFGPENMLPNRSSLQAESSIAVSSVSLRIPLSYPAPLAQNSTIETGTRLHCDRPPLQFRASSTVVSELVATEASTEISSVPARLPASSAQSSAATARSNLAELQLKLSAARPRLNISQKSVPVDPQSLSGTSSSVPSSSRTPLSFARDPATPTGKPEGMPKITTSDLAARLAAAQLKLSLATKSESFAAVAKDGRHHDIIESLKNLDPEQKLAMSKFSMKSASLRPPPAPPIRVAPSRPHSASQNTSQSAASERVGLRIGLTDEELAMENAFRAGQSVAALSRTQQNGASSEQPGLTAAVAESRDRSSEYFSTRIRTETDLAVGISMDSDGTYNAAAASLPAAPTRAPPAPPTSQRFPDSTSESATTHLLKNTLATTCSSPRSSGGPRRRLSVGHAPERDGCSLDDQSESPVLLAREVSGGFYSPMASSVDLHGQDSGYSSVAISSKFFARPSGGALQKDRVAVIDNGSYAMRVGLADSESPTAIFPTVISPSTSEEMRSIGEAALRATEGRIKDRCYPYAAGTVTNWDAMECIWAHCLDDLLTVDTSSTSVLLTEGLHPPRAGREKTAELMFELFDVASLYLHVQPPLALYASGMTSGVVIDSGQHATSIFPVYDGYQLPNACLKVPYGGAHMTELLHRQLLVNRPTSGPGCWSPRSLSLETANDIKEKYGFVQTEYYCFESDPEASSQGRRYYLPDGSVVQVRSEAFRCTEKMFQTNLDDHMLTFNEGKALPLLVLDSINSCDVDMRKSLLSKVTLSGGNSMFQGLPLRLSQELKTTLPIVMSPFVEVHAPEERDLSVWRGGAILSALSTFEEQWITRSDYEEDGMRIVHHKCPVYL